MWKANKEKKKFSFTLKFSILTTFITLFVALTFVIFIIRAIAFKSEVGFASFQLMERTSSIVLKEITSGINPIEANGAFTVNLFRSDLIHTNPEKLIDYTYYLVESIPLLQGAFWANDQGDFISAKHERNDTITNEIILRSRLPLYHVKIFHDEHGNVTKVETINNDYDPRTRPWYPLAKKAKTLTWTDVYHFYADQSLGVSAGIPAYDFETKKFLGIFGLDVRLDFLSKFINSLYVSKNGYAFITTNDGELIAYPNHKPFTKEDYDEHELVKINPTTFPVIYGSLEYYNKTGKHFFYYKHAGNRYLVTYYSIPAFAAHGWLVGVIVPEYDLVGPLYTINFLTFIFGLIALLIGIIIVSAVVTYIVKPIKRLVKETEKIKRFELDFNLDISSRIKEVIELTNAISSMKKGLQQFQRYVPKILVRQLIETGQDMKMGGIRKELVVFFSDIEHFTTIAEEINPNELMQQLCEYFEALTQIVMDQKGTIDKYIGDSIMAFWGAPLPSVQSSQHAARAALECQRKVAELNMKWQEQGKKPFNTRIGIHKGEAIVGNLGSSERLNYTAIGDTINIANRLEVINKRYHTHIIVSETVYQEIKDQFYFRMLDSVIARGRTHPIIIYELLGDDLAQIPFDLNAYNEAFQQGFTLYQENKRREAIPFFERCLQIYPEDKLAPLFIDRCLE